MCFLFNAVKLCVCAECVCVCVCDVCGVCVHLCMFMFVSLV